MKVYPHNIFWLLIILGCNLESNNISEFGQMEKRDCNFFIKDIYDDSLRVKSEYYSRYSGANSDEFILEIEKQFEYNNKGLLIEERLFDYFKGIRKESRYNTALKYDDLDRLIERTQFSTQQDTIKIETWEYFGFNIDSTEYRVKKSTRYHQRYDHEKLRQLQKDETKETIVFLENNQKINEIEGDISTGVFDTLKWNYYFYSNEGKAEKFISLNTQSDTIFRRSLEYDQGQLKKIIVELPKDHKKSVTFYDENGCSYMLINYDRSETIVKSDTSYYICDTHGQVILSCWKR